MSQPSIGSAKIARSTAGFLSWEVHDDRIDFRSDAYAVPTPAGLLLIDPLPLTEEARQSLPEVMGIALSAGCHQRAAWQLRELLEVPVMAPAGAVLDEAPDAWLEEGSQVAEGVTTHGVKGPTNPHVAFLWTSQQRVLFIGDLLMRDGVGVPFVPVPRKHHENYAATRGSVVSLRELRPDWLCPAHGAATENALLRLEAALSAWEI